MSFDYYDNGHNILKKPLEKAVPLYVIALKFFSWQFLLIGGKHK